MDVNYQDNSAMIKGQGEQWLTDFTSKLRAELPTHLIVHTVNAGYFVGQPIFSKGAYVTVHSNVGSIIDFYNVQYFKQANSVYNSYHTLFVLSSGWAVGTSVNELISKGIPADKIVVGKPATIRDADSSSYIDSIALRDAIANEYASSGWKTGVMLYEFASDINGTILATVVSSISNL